MKQEAAPGQVETKDRLNRQEEKMEDMSQQLQSIAAAMNTAVEEIKNSAATLEEMKAKLANAHLPNCSAGVSQWDKEAGSSRRGRQAANGWATARGQQEVRIMCHYFYWTFIHMNKIWKESCTYCTYDPY